LGESYGTIVRKAANVAPGFFIRGESPVGESDGPDFFFYPPGVTQGASLCELDGTVWRHLVVVYSLTNGTITTYIDGVESDWEKRTNAVQHSGDLFIGGTPLHGNDGGFDGAIDEVRIYNRALASDEVLKLYELDAYPGMARIPAGAFVMGDALDEGSADERPTHSIHISEFYIDCCEMTKSKWDGVANWASGNGYDVSASDGSGRDTNHPVHFVTWYDCLKWCNARSEKEGFSPVYFTDAAKTTVYRSGNVDLNNALVDWHGDGYRLPTEAEWEKAARGGLAGHHYPWPSAVGSYTDTNNLDGSKANYDGSGHPYRTGPTPHTTPVGYFDGHQTPSGTDMANGYGLYDVAGNTFEWCWDWYQANWYSQPNATALNTKGPSEVLTYRVLRGGCWNCESTYMRCSKRHNGGHPWNSYDNVGFRTVRSGTPDALDVGLVAYYPLDGDANDISGNGNHGTAHGDFVADDFDGDGQSMYADGTTADYFDSNINTWDPSNAYAVSMWVKLSEAGRLWGSVDGAGDNAFGTWVHYDGSSFRWHAGGVAAAMTEVDFPVAEPLEDGNWHHLVFVHSEGIRAANLGVRLDGELLTGTVIKDSATQYNIPQPDQSVVFMALRYNGGIYDGPTGELDEVRIYNRALSADEIETLYIPPLDRGLVAHYPFNGNANDASRNGNDGTVQGGMGYAEGILGQAASLDGEDDVVKIVDDGIFRGRSATTVGFWFRSRTTNSLFGILFEKHESLVDFSITGPSMSPKFYLNDTMMGSVGVVHTGVWHHAALAWDGANAAIYLDGVPVGSTPYATPIADTSSPISIGARTEYAPDPFEYGFRGDIDDFRIYNRALSGNEVAALWAQGTTAHYASPSGSSEAPYATWATAATNIQDAVDAASSGDTVWVTNGLYRTGGAFASGVSNRVSLAHITVRSVNGPSFTTIQGAGPLGDGAVRGAYVGENGKLIGFTVTQGHTLTNNAIDRAGGGIMAENGAEIMDCVIVSNRAAAGGAGLYCQFGCTVKDCVISDNAVTQPRVTHNGGGMFASRTLVENCVFTRNESEYGGGIFVSIGSTVRNCLLVDNTAHSGGGAYASWGGIMQNCTVVSNRAVSASQGGGICVMTTTGALIENCIVYDNQAANGDNFWHQGTNAVVSHCCIAPDPGGDANITDAPLFRDAAHGDYRLNPVSPCIDRGNDQAWMANATDLAGNRRVMRSAVDMGAYEESSLVAYYPLNGNANDESGNGHHGVVSGATLAADAHGRSDSAYSFDGDDSILTTFAPLIRPTDSFTVSVWLRSEVQTLQYVLGLERRDHQQLSIRTDPAVSFKLRDDDYASFDCAVSDMTELATRWMNVTATRDGETDEVRVYVDGVLRGEVSDTSAGSVNAVSPMPLGIGAINNSATGMKEFFTGAIDEVRFYNRALPSNEVQRLYEDSLTAPSMPMRRVGGDAIVYDDRIWYVGGYGPGADLAPEVMVYDPDSGSWDTNAAPIPTPRTSLGVAEMNGVIHACGGYADGNPDVATVEAYDVAGNVWTNETPLRNRCNWLNGSTVSHDGKVLTIGGNYYSTDRETAQIFDPALGTWSESSNMGYGARGMAAAVANGVAYAIGGADMGGPGPERHLLTVQTYDPDLDTWAAKADLPQPRAYAEAVVIDGVIYLVGGQSVPDGPVVRDVLRYVPAVDRWETTGIVLTERQARVGMAAVAYGHFIYLLGGVDTAMGQPTDRVDVIGIEGAVTLSGVVVAGDPTVPEGSNAIYTCTASYSDGTSNNVSTQAVWSLSSGTPAGTVITNGLLTAGEVTSNTVITVSAAYAFGGHTATDSLDVTILARPTADFEAVPTNGAAPLAVTFTDLSIGDIDTAEWDFDNDGHVDAVNPAAPVGYVYTNEGLYAVRLVVTGPGGVDTMVKTDYVSVGFMGDHRPVVRVPEDDRQIFISSLGDMAVLDASQSYDPDGDTIYFSWREDPTNPRRGLVPIGSHALSRLHLFFPTSGRYTFHVRVSDGELVSADVETITVYVPGLIGHTTVAGTGGQGISDVRVSAYTNDVDAQSGENPVDIGVADSRGRYNLENVRTASPTNGQTYKIRVERPDFLTNFLDRTILPDPGPDAGDEDFSIGRGYTDVILGTVSARDGGASLNGVTAHLEGHGFQSTFGGVFWFSNVRQGSWSLQLYKEGYQPEVRDINVGTNAPNLDFTLAPATELGRLTGRVTLAGTGRPVPGATVALGAGRTEYTVSTDARGGFIYADLPTGTYLLTASKDGYETLRFLAVSVRPGDNRLDVSLFLETDLTITGRVVDDRNGRAIHLATAGVQADGGLLLNSDVADHCGYFVVSGLAAGEHALRVTAPGYVPETRLYSLAGHQDAGAIRLRRSAFWEEPAGQQPGAPFAALAWSNYYANGLGEVVTLDGRPSQGAGRTNIWRESAENPKLGLLPPGTADARPEIAGIDKPGIYAYELQVQSGGTLSPNTAVARVFVPGIVGNVHASPSDGLEPKEHVAIGLYHSYNDAMTRRNAVRETLSGPDGSFDLSVAPGQYWLTADPEPGSGFEPYGPVGQRVNYSSTMQSVDINLWRSEYIIQGKVTDEDTHELLENVRVAVAPGIITESLRTSTDAGGGFRLFGVPGGGQTILLVKDGYASRSVSVQIPPPPGIPLDMTMTANPSNLSANVSGSVVAEYLGVAFPVPHAEVILEGGLFRTFTDADGRYELGDLPPGYHHGVIRCAGYETSYLGDSPVFRLYAGDNPLPTKTLAFKGNGPVLRGVVLDENQQPVANARVSIVAPVEPGQPPARSAAMSGATVTTDAAGVFQLVNVPHGVRTLRVEPDGAAAMEKIVEVTDSMELAFSLGRSDESIVSPEWADRHFPGVTWPGDEVDSDGDGTDNGTEYVMDTAPTDSNAVFESEISLESGRLEVTLFNTSSNRLYRIESCTDLVNPDWQPLSIDTAGTGDILEQTISNAAERCFYRGRVRVPGE